MAQSVPAPPTRASTHEGYLSEESKRKFTITAGVLGAVFFFLQMLAPFFVMMLFMPAFFFTSFHITDYNFDRATVHDNYLYFFAEEQGPRVKKGRSKLIALDLARVPAAGVLSNEKTIWANLFPKRESGIEPEEVAELGTEPPWLLAGGENLLLISQSKMLELKDGTLAEVASYASLGNISRPFFYHGLPAVVEGRPDGLFLAVFESGRWSRSPVFLEKGEDFRDVERRIQVISIGEANHMFLKIGKVLFHRVGLPLAPSNNSVDVWRSVGVSDCRWQSFALDGRPTVVFSGSGGLRSVAFHEGKWSETQHVSSTGASAYDFLPLSSVDGSLRVAIARMPSSFRIYSIRGDDLVLDARFGSGFPFPRMFFPMMFIPQVANLLFPILLAFILSGLMLRHRVSTHSHGGETAQYASLIRRAFAQVVDGIILVAGMSPFIIGWLSMFRML